MNKCFLPTINYLQIAQLRSAQLRTAQLRTVITVLLLCTGLLVLFSSATYANSIAQDVPPPPSAIVPSELPLIPTPTPPTPRPSDSEPAMNFFCEEGSAAIFGTVVDPDGNPVMDANVTIKLTPINDPTLPTAPAPTQYCGTIVTNADGEFAIENIVAGKYMLMGSPAHVGSSRLIGSESLSVIVAEGESVQLDEPIQLGYVQAFAKVAFPIDEVDSVRGQVFIDRLNDAGECSMQEDVGPLPFVVHLHKDSIRQDGFVSFNGIEPGTYCMHANVNTTGGSTISSAISWIMPAPINITIPADARRLDLGQIELLAPPKRIVGTVVDESGLGYSHASIEGIGPMGSDLSVMTDESGHFEFVVAGQSWTLNMYLFSGSASSDNSQRVITFADDETAEEQSVQFTVKRNNSSITGRLLDVNGTPLVSARFTDPVHIVAIHENDGPIARKADADGIFTIPLQPGTYRVMVDVDNNILRGTFPPPEFEVVLEEDMTLDLGDILMRGPQVTAQVADLDGVTPQRASYRFTSATDSDGVMACNEEVPETSLPVPPPPVPDAEAPADSDVAYPSIYEPTYQGYGTTDENGWLQIGGLVAGEYCLTLKFSTEDSWYNAPLETTFSIVDENALLDLGTLVRKAPSKHAVGSITQADGTAVVGMNVSATLHSSSNGGWVQTATDETGAFALDLGPGNWQINIDLRSSYGPSTADGIFYSVGQQWFADDDSIMLRFEHDESEETQSANFVVTQTNATITGKLLKPDGTPATGFSGQVRAFSEQFEDAWTNSAINPETAEFELSVIGGEWQIAYHLDGFYYGVSSDYIGAIAPIAITVDDGSVLQQDFTLMAYDATIRGAVLYPDGSPVPDGYAQLRSVANTAMPHGRIYRGAEIVDGEFEVTVLSGLEYEIGVDLKHNMETSGDYMQPNKERITPAADSTTDLVMQFIEPDSTIVGIVYQSETGEPAADAAVTVWSLGGQYRHVNADANGAFSVTVQSGATWYMSAWWWSQDGVYMYYQTDAEVEVEVAEAGERTQDLTVAVQDYSLPQAVEATFDSSTEQSITLDDGTMIEIPAAAVPVEDIDGHDVRVEIAPLTADLPSSYTTDAVDYGYDIRIFNNHTGEEISAELNHDIIVTYQYEDSALAEMSADEATLAPTIRTTDSDAWDTAENFTVNPEKNELRLSISQASEAAVTVRPNRQPKQSYFNFMPLAFD